ncbi:hypothetical protein KIL84_016192, partial [Mauremys mutica]
YTQEVFMKNELLQSLGQILRNITITFFNCLRQVLASRILDITVLALFCVETAYCIDNDV